MNRRNFSKALASLPLAGVIPCHPIDCIYEFSESIEKKPRSEAPPDDIPDWINGWRHLTWPHREEVLDYHDVKFPPPVMENIYQQVESLVGCRVVYFVPSADDANKFKELGGDIWVPLEELKKHTPEENKKVWEESYKIGVLRALRENNGIEVQVSIDDKFQIFPFRSYGLYLGIDSNHTRFEPYDEPIDYSKKFVVKSCKIKGLYFKSVSNPNGGDFRTGIDTYYKCRMLEMFMYLPGRAYY